MELEAEFVPQDIDIPPINIAELILPLATAIKAKGSSVDKIFKIYDKDKSFLLSAKEIGLAMKSFLQIEIEQAEEDEISRYIRATFSASTNRKEVKRAEFTQMLSMKYEPKFLPSQDQAIKDLKSLNESLSSYKLQ